MLLALFVPTILFATPDSAGAAVPSNNYFPILARNASVCADSYGAPRSGGRTHQGDDCFAPAGTPLIAVESGTAYSGSNDLGGNTVWLIGDSGTAYYYAHNRVNHVGQGQRVAKGQTIAEVGNTGNAATTPAHVHFQIHPTGRSGPPVDPYPYLAQWASYGGAPPPPQHLLWIQRDGLSSGPASRSFVYGLAGDIPVVGDWNGDGIETPGIYRPSTSDFHLKNTNSGGDADLTFHYGAAGQGFWPVVGDWDGNGTDTVGLFNVNTAEWHLRNTNSGGSAQIVVRYGSPGDVPVAGDWDGDGDTTLGVIRVTTFFLQNSISGGSADHTFGYGQPGDFRPLVGDWNASGGSEGIGVVRGNQWLLRYTLSAGDAQMSFTFGRAGDYFIPGDWNGSGRPDPGVIRAV